MPLAIERIDTELSYLEDQNLEETVEVLFIDPVLDPRFSQKLNTKMFNFRELNSNAI